MADTKMQQIERFADRSLNELSDLEGQIKTWWEKSLLAEGIAQHTVIGGKGDVSVKNEIDALVAYEKLMCFLDSTEYDIENRERFLWDKYGRFFSKNSLRKKPAITQSFIPRAVKNLATTYKWGAERTLENEAQQEKYSLYLRQAQVNTKSKRWSKVYELTGACAVIPTVKMHRGKKKADLMVLAPNSFRCLYDDYGNLVTFMYSSWTNGENGMERIIVVWKQDAHYYRDVDGKEHAIEGNENMVNPYGDIPVAIFTADPGSPFHGGGRTSLVDANLHANFLELLGSVDSAFAAIGVWFANNIPAEITSISPDQVIIADSPDGASLAYINGEEKGETLRTLRDKAEKTGLMNEGLSPATLAAEVTELSGIALRNLDREMMEQREDTIEIMEDGERELYYVCSKVWNKEIGGNLPEDEDAVMIDFAEPVYEDDPQKAREQEEYDLKYGFVSIVEIARRHGVEGDTDEDIIAQINDNRAQYANVSKKTGIVDLFKGTGADADKTTQTQTDLLKGTTT